MPTRRQQILAAVIARLTVIEMANGFQTDAGATVTLGDVVALGPDDPVTVIGVVAEDTQPLRDRMELLPVDLQAITRADLEQPYVQAEIVIADIAQAMELADRTLGGLVKEMEVGATRLLPREPGSTTVGVAVRYELTYVRVWGAP